MKINPLTPGIIASIGLEQGCCLSPTLCKVYHDGSLKNLETEMRHDGKISCRYHTLSFPDNQVVNGQDYDDLIFMIIQLTTEYKNWRLEVDINRTMWRRATKVLVKGNKDLVKGNGTIIKQCHNNKYLRSDDWELDKEFKERNTLGR